MKFILKNYYSVIIDLIDAARSLTRKKFQSFLSTLGILIGVASIIVMISIIETGMKKSLQQIESLGLNTIRIKHISLTNISISKLNLSSGLSDRDLKTIKKIIGNNGIVAQIYKSKQSIFYGSKDTTVDLIGTTNDFFRVENITLKLGRFFSSYEIYQRQNVAIISNDLFMNFLGGNFNANLIIKGEIFKIIGVVGDKDYLKNFVIIPFSVYSSMIKVEHFDEINILVKKKNKVVSYGKKIKKLLKLLHNNIDDFKVVLPLEMIEKEKEARRLNYFIIIAIAAMSLITGGIGIMNIMLANLSEKTREIGLRMAVGATSKRILRLVLFESLVLTIIGGIFGILSGILIVIFFEFFTSIDVNLSFQALIVAIVMTFFTGIIFGIYPGIKASQIEPMEALREYN